ncbi:MAG: hypothetical protein D6754_00115, partial [Alphaproteobacteria bacterium]
MADLVGYTRLMGEDETAALAALQSLRAEILDPAFARHRGRVVKLMGDGTLVEFASVVEAVKCAVDIQNLLSTRMDAPGTDEPLALRIGINLGDVIVEGDDIYGDGVNLASRLEAMAEPGGICVSQTVVDQVRGKLPVAFEDLGEQRLKNIADPVPVFRVGTAGSAVSARRRSGRLGLIAAGIAAMVLVAGIAIWEFVLRPDAADAIVFDESKALARPSGPTIAVLPFENLSGDPAQDYLADGISEDVIVELGRFRDLNVLSRRSTSGYRDKTVDLRELGRRLGADYVLEGSVRTSGERLRATARLSDARTGAQVWSEAFDEALSASTLFDVQIRITQRVASAVGNADGAIRRLDERRARTKPPESLSSYECSMLRIGFEYSSELQDRIRGCILRVVEAEPDYWRGWAQLADALRTDVMIFGKRYEGTQAEKLQRALAAARKAVSLNPDAPRAHFVLAFVRLMLGDREGFFSSAEDALALGGDRLVEGDLGFWLVRTGRYELGAAVLRRTIELDPENTSAIWHRGLANYHFIKGEYEAALDEYRKGAQPDFWWSVAEEV